MNLSGIALQLSASLALRQQKAFINLPGFAMQLSTSLALREHEAFMNLPGIVLQLYTSLAMQQQDAFINLPGIALQSCLVASRGFHKPAWHCLAAIHKPHFRQQEAFMNLSGIAMQMSARLTLRKQKAHMNLPGIALQLSACFALQQSADAFMNLSNNNLTLSLLCALRSLLAVCRCLRLSGSFRVGLAPH